MLSRVLVAGTALCSLVLLAACPPAPPLARAARVATRAELIGGPRALGEVGDWLLENDKVRFIIQDEGFSRGFGVFGGALLDADLVRPEAGRGNSAGAAGKDNFGEMFPAFFLEALNPISLPGPDGQPIPAIEVDKNADGTLRDGSDGKEAVIIVRALGDDFLAITQNVNETVLGDQRANPSFLFETRYILKPGAQHLEIETRIQNRLPTRIEFPKELLNNQIPAPFGDVVLFGAGNKVFVPHEAGFDLRFRLEDVYAAGNIALPAFPGLVAEFIASASKDVSYGVMTFPPDTDKGAVAENFAFKNRDVFPDATEHSLHVPFIASAFTGVFQVVPPDEIAPNDGQFGGPDEFFVRRAFIVGDGDVASISDVVYDDLLGEGDTLGTLQGRVQERQRPQTVDGASIIVLDELGEKKITQARSNRDGRFDAKLRPGKYRLVVVVPSQDPSPPVAVEIKTGETVFETLFVDSAAEVVVTVVEEGVGPVPAKVTLVGTVEPGHAGDDPKDFLFDLSVGQPFIYTDLVDDVDDDVDTRRYVEAFASSADGVVRLKARTNGNGTATYTLVASRGTEYERFEKEVTLTAGAVVNVTATIKRGIDSSGYVGSDFHLHSQFSLDSAARVDERVANYAAEGIEYAVSTDHNFVVDYQPSLQKLGLERFMNTGIGLELTTIDRGHFNGFPLDRGDGSLVDVDGDGKLDTIASRTYGSIEWALRKPQDIFDDLRKLGRKDAAGVVAPVIVQVNHPRDSILGYFDQYGVNPDTLEPEGIVNALLSPNAQRHPEFDKSNFSFDFDAIEVFNGKHFEFLHTFVVPEDAPRLRVGGRDVVVEPVSCCEVQVGDVVRDTADRECPGEADECACDVATFNFQIAQDNCDRVGDIAFPGVTEDWMKILDTLTLPGHRMIGTANSDSHEPEKEEPGSPRTYVGVPNDDPSQVLPEDISRAFRETGDVLMSNGPFMRLTTTGSNEARGFGGIVSAQDGAVTVNVHLESASWVDMDLVRIYQDGKLVHEERVDGAGKHDLEPIELEVAIDGWYTVEVLGNDSLFPVVYPNEIPPLQFTDVIGALGASFGLGGNDALLPDRLFPTTPYAMSNPVWLDADGDGEIAPKGVLPNPAELSTALDDAQRAHVSPGVMREVNMPWVETEAESRYEAWRALPLRKRVALQRLPQWMWPSDRIGDVRRSLLQFVNHAEP